MPRWSALTDEELLASQDTEAFGVFYDRHAAALLGYFARRVPDAHVAADLTAETFASAIVAQRRYAPSSVPALAWLYTIARRRLVDYHRRGEVDTRMRDRLAMRTPRVDPEDAALIDVLAQDAVADLLAGLPADQSAAITAHVLEEQSYGEVAGSLQTSEAVVRQRVSRGFAALRRRLGGAP